MTANTSVKSDTTDQETAHLISMANDVAANLSFHTNAEERIADHFRRFWAPRMRSLLLDYAHGDGQALSPAVRSALGKL